VVIIDDVITTGATVEAIAEALRDAGAARIRAWSVARTPAPGR
jgi:predicted amidophosphoribosyltransferase